MSRSTDSLAFVLTLAFVHHALAQNPTMSLIPLVDDVRRECVGGPNDGKECSTTADCEMGPDCQRTCEGNSPNPGQPCDSAADCGEDYRCVQECFCNRVIQAVPDEVLTIEIKLANWSPNGEQLKAWQAVVDMRSASQAVLPLGWDLPTSNIKCDFEADCPEAYPLCAVHIANSCEGLQHDPGLGVFADTSRSDYVFFGLSEVGPFFDTISLYHRFASVLFSPSDSVPYSEPKYCATLLLKVLPSIGESAILMMGAFDRDSSFILDSAASRIGPLDTEGLTIEIVEQPPTPGTTPIPTTSTWGIVALSLVLLAGAKVYFGRNAATD